MMSMSAVMNGKTPVEIAKQISHSKSKTRSSTTIERRDDLARKTLFWGVPINQFEVGGSSSASKHGFMTPRKGDHKTNNSILHPMDDAEEKPCNVLDPFKYGYGYGSAPTKSASGTVTKRNSTIAFNGSQVSTQRMKITTTSGTASVVNRSELHTPKRSVQNGLRSSTMILSESHTAPKKAFSSYGLHKHDVIPEKIEQKTSLTAKGIRTSCQVSFERKQRFKIM